MLPDDKLQALCTALFNGHTISNSQTGMLRSANREPPKPAGIAPAPFDPAANACSAKAKIQPGAPPLYAAPKTPPAKKTRPGWLGGSHDQVEWCPGDLARKTLFFRLNAGRSRGIELISKTFLRSLISPILSCFPARRRTALLLPRAAALAVVRFSYQSTSLYRPCANRGAAHVDRQTEQGRIVQR